MKTISAAALGLVFLLGVVPASYEKACAARSTGGAEAVCPEPAWEARYVKEARVTIEKGVMSVMSGLSSPEQLQESVDYFCRTWESWADSRLFILQDDRDIDVYGNLYSLQVLCRTLRLAAEDLHEEENSARSEAVLEKAVGLEQKSRLLAEPVAEIISRQSYSAYLPRRIELMKEQFGYVDVFYALHSFRSALR